MAAIVFDKAHSPYLLNTTLTIAENDTLIILKGTTLVLDTAVDIVVYGNIFIEGTEDEPVNLIPLVDTIGWGRIYLHKPGSNNHFKNAKIVDGTVLSLDANLTYRNIHFINRQNLPLHFNITRIERAMVDIQNCTLEGSGKGEGFLLINTTDASIRGCSFFNIPDAIEITKLKNSRISNNFFAGIPDDAIDLNNCEYVIVDSNTILNAHDRGIEIGSEIFGSSKNISVHRNLIINCKEGIVFKEGSTGTVLNNTLYHNKVGVVCKEIGPTPGGSSVSVENTIFSQSVWADIDSDSLSTISVNYSISDRDNLPGVSNIFSDPQFLDSENSDFTLKSTSPCIDAGNPDSWLDPDGTLSDLGAYFYNQDSSSTIPDITGIESVQVYPNPFQATLHVKYTLKKSASIKIELFNIDGRKVEILLNKNQIPGSYHITSEFIEGKEHSNGIYLCVIAIDQETKKIKVMKFN